MRILLTPGVNHTTVAEHNFCLLLALVRNLVSSTWPTLSPRWKLAKSASSDKGRITQL